MAPGIELFARLQPFFIRLGDIIVIIVFVLSVLITVATFAYVLGREWGWWRRAEETSQAAQPQND
jgi:hypothetical protein